MDSAQYEQIENDLATKESKAYKIINNKLFVKHGRWKRVIKQPDHKEIIRAIHDLAHSGKRRTLDKIKELYWWPGMMNHVSDYIESCDSCQRDKKPRHKYPLNPIAVSGPFEIVGIDHVGPLAKSKKGYEYIIVAQDYLTKWPIAEAVKTTNAEEALAFVRDRIMTVYGSPKQIITDQGAAFTSHQWSLMMKTWKIKHVTTSAANPQANGQVERMNQTILKSLRRTLGSRKEIWPDILQLVLMDYRVSTQDTTGYSPSQLLYGRQMRLPIEADFEARESEDWDKAIKKRITQLDSIEMNQVTASEKIKTKQQKMKERYDKGIKRQKKTFEVGEQVLLYGPKDQKLATTGTGPYKIISKGRYNSYELELGGKIRWASGTRLDHYTDRSGDVHVDI
jgi:hypothetical protein